MKLRERGRSLKGLQNFKPTASHPPPPPEISLNGSGKVDLLGVVCRITMGHLGGFVEVT